MNIVTYNIQYSRGQDDRFDLPRVAAAIPPPIPSAA